MMGALQVALDWAPCRAPWKCSAAWFHGALAACCCRDFLARCQDHAARCRCAWKGMPRPPGAARAGGSRPARRPGALGAAARGLAPLGLLTLVTWHRCIQTQLCVG